MELSKEETTATKPKPLKKEQAAAAVADLEKRLADLSAAPAPAKPQGPTLAEQQAAKQQQATKPAAATTTTTSGGGKNALLARIMAAQERAKQQQQQAPAPVAPPVVAAPPPTFAAPPPSFAAPSAPAPAAPSMDLLDFGAPAAQSAPPPAFGSAPASAFASSGPPPPPSFDAALLPPAPPPPAFDAASLPAAPPPAAMTSFDPHPPALKPPSAPAFEDLMMETPPMPPPVQAPPPQQQQPGLDEEAIRAIMSIEGLTEADKKAMIDEQLKIMKSIEDKKKTTQVSAADAFEQRSYSASVQAINNSNVRVQGQERTREAIQDGTAVMVCCKNCQNWMQVTGDAQLMFCPVCQTVSPVKEGEGALSEQEMSDAKLAEMLQKEEYEQAERTQQQSTTAAQPKSNSSSKKSSTQSWSEWLGFGSPAPAPQPPPAAASRSSTEEVEFGRTATQQPLFACVTDSINSAANYAMNAGALGEDAEGNVHGVDSSSLLAIPQVGRNKDNNQN